MKPTASTAPPPGCARSPGSPGAPPGPRPDGRGGWPATPSIAAALAAGQLPVSLARLICDGTDQLPEEFRDDADGILLAAVLGGADQHDLARLAREMLERARTSPDTGEDGFEERALWLGTTFGGAGRLQGDLTPACAAALTVVLDALGQKTGPEDTRTAAQRRHDAIEEACRRLISGQLIPGRDGQPAHLIVHVDLNDLRGRSAAERSWTPALAAAGPGTVHLTGAAAQAAACDAMLTPVVTGQIDRQALHHLTGLWLTLHTHDHTPAGRDGQDPDGGRQATAGPRGQAPDDSHRATARPPGRPRHAAATATARPGETGHGGGQDPARRPDLRRRPGPPAQPRPRPRRPAPATAPAPAPAMSRSPAPATPPAPPPAGRDCGIPGCLEATRQRLQATITRWSLDLVSGPGGLASCLRGTLLAAPFSTPSQPLDIGRTTRTIPPHLRTAVTLRDQHCQFPSCRQPASVCEVHHLIHWAHGGPTSLPNLILLCRFHHQIAIHRWGWNITRHPDGTTHRHRTRRPHPPLPQPTPASRLTSGDQTPGWRDPPHGAVRQPGGMTYRAPARGLRRTCFGDWFGGESRRGGGAAGFPEPGPQGRAGVAGGAGFYHAKAGSGDGPGQVFRMLQAGMGQPGGRGQVAQVSSVRRPEDALERPGRPAERRLLQQGEDAAPVVVDHDQAQIGDRLARTDDQPGRIMQERQVADERKRRPAAGRLVRERRTDRRRGGAVDPASSPAGQDADPAGAPCGGRDPGWAGWRRPRARHRPASPQRGPAPAAAR